MKCGICGFLTSNICELDEHKKDTHGEKVRWRELGEESPLYSPISSSDSLSSKRECETVSEINYEKESVLYSPISSGSFTSDSEWETVSQVSFQDDPPIKDVTVPVVPWRLIPVDIAPTQPLDGRPYGTGWTPGSRNIHHFSKDFKV